MLMVVMEVVVVVVTRVARRGGGGRVLVLIRMTKLTVGSEYHRGATGKTTTTASPEIDNSAGRQAAIVVPVTATTTAVRLSRP